MTTEENKHFRSTWANINKGLALILLAIPISLLMYGLWNEFPQCDDMYCDGWKNPEIAELYWQIGRLEITFMVIFAITMISYEWK